MLIRLARRATRNNRRRAVRIASPAIFEHLENRILLSSAAYDLIGLDELRANPAYSDLDGTGVSIAILDTGLDSTHPDIAPNYLAWFDSRYASPSPNWVGSHGTHVAGIAASSNPDIGVATDASIVAVQVFDRLSFGKQGAQPQSVIDGLLWVLENRDTYNIVAVNMSLGSGFYESTQAAIGDFYAPVIDRLEAAGITVISAAGNDYAKTPGFANSASPGIFSTLSVGAVWETNEGPQVAMYDLSTGADRITSFSQRPPLAVGNAIFAPGALIRSTVPGGGYEEQAGTSMASPMVAGAVAIVQEASLRFGGRLLRPDEIRSILISTGDVITDGDDEDSSLASTGLVYRRLNIFSAVQHVESMFAGLGGSRTDPNSTMNGAIWGPLLNGVPTTSLTEAIGTDADVQFVAADRDLFRFEVAVEGTVTISVNVASGAGMFSGSLQLYDSSGVRLAGSVGATGSLSITSALVPGTYYAGVSSSSNAVYNPLDPDSGASANGPASERGRYEIAWSIGMQERNGLLANAWEIVTFAGDGFQQFGGTIGADYGQFVGVGDVDLFKITVPDHGSLLIDIDTPFATGFVDSFLRVFDANGVEVRWSDDDLAYDWLGNSLEFPTGFGGEVSDGFGGFEGHETDSIIEGEVFRGEVYYIGVSSYENSVYDPARLQGRTANGLGGSYQLSVAFISNDRNGSLAQWQNTWSLQLPVVDFPGIIGVDPDLQGGGIVEVGNLDVDFVELVPVQSGLMRIAVDSFAIAGNLDPLATFISLYDDEGNFLAFGINPDNGDPELYFEVQAGVRYNVAISSADNLSFDPWQTSSGTPGQTGVYRLSASIVPLNSTLQAIANDRMWTAGISEIQSGFDPVGGFLLVDDLRLFRQYRAGENGEPLTNDIDLFRFIAPRDGAITVTTLTDLEFSADTYLRIFDAQGNELAANDNASSQTRGSRASIDVVNGSTYFIGVSGAGVTNYDPRSAMGTSGFGSAGLYQLRLLFATDQVRIDHNRSLDISASPDGGFTVSGVNPAGTPVVFTHNGTTGAWIASDPGAGLSNPEVSEELVSWIDPKDGLARAAGLTIDGVVLFTQSASGNWSFRNLTAEVTGGRPIATSLQVMITPNGQVNLTGLNSSGDLVRYYNNGEGTPGQYGWSFMDIAGTQLRRNGVAMPELNGPLLSYATDWGGLNVVGLDSSGDVWSIWWAPGRVRWQTANLTVLTGAPSLEGALTEYSAAWASIHVAGLDANGHLRVLWWTPDLAGDWQTSDLTAASGGPVLSPNSLSSYTTDWGGLNVVGITRSSQEIAVYWWTPESSVWGIDMVGRKVGLAAGSMELVMAIGVTGQSVSAVSLNIIAVDDTGEVYRLYWKPEPGSWQLDDITQMAGGP